MQDATSPISDSLRPQSHSHNRIVETAFRKSAPRRRTASVLYVISMLIYLGWRLTTLNADHIIISSLYYFAEVMGLVLGLVVIYNSWRISYREITPPPPNLEVDVFIPTYKEPFEVIERTLAAACKIDYPHQTWVLDDAGRDDVRNLASHLGIKYICRGNNIGAKAGNLNHAIQLSRAEFIAVFDADHIPQPEALDMLLGQFADHDVAMVQTPQEYYNTEAFQYMNPKRGKGYWHDQSFFYNIALASNDKHNAASCVGTGVVYRRSALNHIDGIPDTTLTEDIHTSLKLHKAGYKTVYINEPVAFGLAAADLDEYYTTRHRWAHGNLEALKQEKILNCSGLSWKQRLSYLSLGLIYLEGWQQLILFLTPVISLLFGIPPFEISVFNVVTILLFPIITYLLLQEIGGGYNRFWTNEIYSMIRWPIHLLASFALIGKKLKWHSSKKKLIGELDIFLMLPQLLIMLLSIAAILVGFSNLDGEAKAGPIALYLMSLTTDASAALDIHSVMEDGYSIELFIVAGAWAIFNIVKVVLLLLKALRSSSQNSGAHWFPVDLPVLLESGRIIRCKKVSLDAAVFDSSFYDQLSQVKCLTLLLPSGRINVQIANIISGDDLTLEFNWQSEQKTLFSNSIYSPSWYRDTVLDNAIFKTPVTTVLTLFSFNKPQSAWKSAAIVDPQYGAVLAQKRSDSQGNVDGILCFDPKEIGGSFRLENIDKDGGDYTILSEEPILSIPGKGLYGRYYYRYKVKKIA